MPTKVLGITEDVKGCECCRWVNLHHTVAIGVSDLYYTTMDDEVMQHHKRTADHGEPDEETLMRRRAWTAKVLWVVNDITTCESCGHVDLARIMVIGYRDLHGNMRDVELRRTGGSIEGFPELSLEERR